jgi:Na+-transporting NADH:ubiquinone oxidoreductase subunit A
MKISIKRGLTVRLAGAPEQVVYDANPVTKVGLMGSDLTGIRAEMLVAEGEDCVRGAPLFRDRKRPEIVFTAPVSGRVEEVRLGAKRRLEVLVISRAGDDSKRFDVPAHPDRASARRLILESGLWPSLRSRPFGRVPDPDTAPDAIFVTAIDTNSHAADPRIVLAPRRDAFDKGTQLLKLLTDGPVFVCQSPGEALVVEDERVRLVEVAGPHPAGLAGTHIHRLLPVNQDRHVWQIHYSDVATIGRLFQTGELHTERVIAVSGPGIKAPRLARVPMGADLHELTAGALVDTETQILTGAAVGGRESRFLGRYHWQATILRRRNHRSRPAWLKLLAANGPSPFIPTEALENALAIEVPVVPLLRALSIGDAENAARLGCLDLIEEDMALATYATGGALDFGERLRAVLDTLEQS